MAVLVDEEYRLAQEQFLILDWMWNDLDGTMWAGPGILTFDRLSDWSIARLRANYPLLAEAA